MRGIRYAALALALARSANADDGKLDRARDEMRDEGSGGDDRDDSDCNLPCLLLQAVVDVILHGEGDGYEESGAAPSAPPPRYGFARHPYEYPQAHYLVPLEPELASAAAPGHDLPGLRAALHARSWAGQVALDAGHLDGLTRGGLFGRVLLPGRWELDARAAWMLEALPEGGRDQASTGTAHVAYRVLEAHALMLRLGGGLRYWVDEELAAAGASLVLGLDLFPVRPFVITAQIAGGNLDSAVAADARVQLGIALGRVELLAGFDWQRIGEVDLSMPVLGTRIWL